MFTSLLLPFLLFCPFYFLVCNGLIVSWLNHHYYFSSVLWLQSVRDVFYQCAPILLLFVVFLFNIIWAGVIPLLPISFALRLKLILVIG